jgi:enamine deaminase RidA (YjgF/YER057c/UK114 family)
LVFGLLIKTNQQFKSEKNPKENFIMAQNPEALAKQKAEKVEYEWGTLWPHYHKEKMNWATGFRTKGDVDILFLSGSTGRDPFEDAPCRTPEQERWRGKVVGGIMEEQTRQCLDDIKIILRLRRILKNHRHVSLLPEAARRRFRHARRDVRFLRAKRA